MDAHPTQRRSPPRPPKPSAVSFIDESGQDLTAAGAIHRLAAEGGVQYLELHIAAQLLDQSRLEQQLIAAAKAAGFSVQIHWRGTSHLALEQMTRIMTGERIRQAMNEPPTW